MQNPMDQASAVTSFPPNVTFIERDAGTTGGDSSLVSINDADVLLMSFCSMNRRRYCISGTRVCKTAGKHCMSQHGDDPQL